MNLSNSSVLLRSAKLLYRLRTPIYWPGEFGKNDQKQLKTILKQGEISGYMYLLFSLRLERHKDLVEEMKIMLRILQDNEPPSNPLQKYLTYVIDKVTLIKIAYQINARYYEKVKQGQTLSTKETARYFKNMELCILATNDRICRETEMLYRQATGRDLPLELLQNLCTR
ncbi:hypothetical protein GS399_13365 [Pedobacter sp. HMF7647]|uniref:Uncharacterized protein n=1 Tax=Hufsiella arboris TaxID=2695275 RepID=A0A7K1YBK6_9SPHI|nr:hypothetical protein [Hufsiella arboris]MXV51966.1 hypothetical protein [Hufsiella arboris]